MTDKPAAPSPPEQRICLHPYLSTACLHGKHELCRKVCKFCGAPCQCRDCVHAAFSGSYYLKDGYVYCSGCHRAPEYCGCAPSPLPSAPAITVHEAEQKLQWQASAVPAPSSDPILSAPVQQLYATEYPTNLMGATVPAPPSPAPIDRASWQAGVSAAILKVASCEKFTDTAILRGLVLELQSLEPPFPAPVSRSSTSEVSTKEVMPNVPAAAHESGQPQPSAVTGGRHHGLEASESISGLNDLGKLAYLSGLIDGEGTIRIERKMSPTRKGHSPGYEAQITIVNTSQELAAWIVHNFPQANKCQERIRKPWKPIYRITWLCGAAEEIAKAVFPFLVVKRRQARLIADLRRVLSEGQRKRLSEDELGRRHALFLECKRLNSGGRNAK